MGFSTFDVEPAGKKKHKIFKIGCLWCFKYFFDDKEIFKALLEYYSHAKYQFELGTVGARNKIMKYLWREGFEPVLIEDPSIYTVR